MALLTTLDELMAHVPFTLGMNMDNMASFIAQAEDQFLVPAIGAEAYADIHDRYQAGAIDGPDYTKLLALCQRSLAYYATLLFIPVGQLHISDAGIRIASDEHFKQAFDWQIHNLEESCRNAADLNLELTLALLEAKPDVFTAYHESEALQRRKEVFVNSAALLNELAGVKLPRRFFLMVLPNIKALQYALIPPILCEPLYKQILMEWNNNEVSYDNRKLLDFIQPALAQMAIAKSVSALTLDFSNLGITHLPANVSRLNIREAASDSERSHFIQDKMQEGREALSRLDEYLKSHATDYPLYASSPCYQQPLVPQYQNQSPSGLYIV